MIYRGRISFFIAVLLFAVCAEKGFGQQSGELDLSFYNGSDTYIPAFCITRHIDGRYILGGHNKTHAALPNGSPDPAFNSNNIGPTYSAGSSIGKVLVQPDGKIFILGSFSTPQPRLARLHTNGNWDNSFSTGAGFSTSAGSGYSAVVYDIALQADGKLIVVGAFNLYRGTMVNSIVRLNPDGSLDQSFNAGLPMSIDNKITAVAQQPDGKIVIGGPFTLIDGQNRTGIARLHASGSVDNSFSPGGSFTMITSGAGARLITIQPDGKILVIGDFSHYNGVARNRLVRINSDGSLDSTFDPGSGPAGTANMHALALQQNGKILIGGAFSSFNGVSASRLVRLHPDGSVDNSFNTMGPNHEVRGIYVEPDGKIVICGYFSQYAGEARHGLARLHGDMVNSASVESSLELTKVYPNPFQSALTLNFPLTITGSVTITLRNAIGKSIFQKDVVPENTTFHIAIPELHDLPSGMYILEVSHSSATTQYKVIRQ